MALFRLGFTLNACCFLGISLLGNDLTLLVGALAASALFTLSRRLG